MPKERAAFILEELDKYGEIKVSRISKQLGCCELTVRRDIQRLNEQGLLRRIHGGAVKVGSNFVTSSVKDNIHSNISDKIQIAKAAYSLIREDDAIIIDDASTCMYLANMIKQNPRRHLRVVTNSILMASELMELTHVDLFVIGGEVAKNLSATAGEVAIDNCAGLRVDKAFVGVNGICLDGAVTVMDFIQKRIKEQIIASAREAYILADGSKFEKEFLSELCRPQDVAGIITTSGVKAQYLEAAQQAGVRLLDGISKQIP